VLTGWSVSYPIGSVQAMDQGFFPLVVSVMIGVIGLGRLASALLHNPGIEVQIPSRRPLLALASILLFAATIRPAGFVVASTLLVVVAGLAHPANTVRSVIVSGAVLILGGWLVFIVLLGAPVRPWPEF
jgi:hypothetical protein